MKKTAIAIATAASLSLFAGPLLAEKADEPEDPKLTIGQPDSEAAELEDRTAQDSAQPQGQGQGQGQAISMDADAIMEHYDENNDGELNEEELSVFGATAAGQGEPDQLMQRLDEDGDGAVTKEELKQSDMVKSQGGTGTGTTQ